jgi:chromosome segregation ATPase
LQSKLQRSQQEVDRLSSELQQVTTATGADLQHSRAEVSRLTVKVTALERDLTQSREEGGRSAELCESLKAQVEQLRREMKDALKDAAAKLQVTRARAFACELVCELVRTRVHRHIGTAAIRFML